MPGKRNWSALALNAEQQRLVEENISLAPYIILKYYVHDMSSDEDLISLGHIALCKAAATYDPNTGKRFCTYAGKCILNEIRHHFSVLFCPRRWNGAAPVSLNTMLFPGEDDEGNVELMDTICDPNTDVAAEAIGNIYNKQIHDVVASYAPTLTEMIDDDLTTAECGKRRHLSKQRISQMVQKEIRRARYAISSQKLA